MDSKIVEEALRVNGVCMRLDTQIKLEERERKREDIKFCEVIKVNKVESDVKLKEVEKEMSRRLQLLLE